MPASLAVVVRGLTALIFAVLLFNMLADFEFSLPWFGMSALFLFMAILFGLGTMAAWEKMREPEHEGNRVVVGQCKACGKNIRVERSGVKPETTLICECGETVKILRGAPTEN